MKLEETPLSSNVVYEGKIVRVRMDEAALPDGKVVTREVVEHPGGVAVLPLTSDGNVVMVRQFRYPFLTLTLEIPAGKLEPNEDPAVCAARELYEETGYTTEQLRFLGVIYPSPGVYGEKLYLYEARDLESHSACPDEDEWLAVEHVPLSVVLDGIRRNEIKDAKTVSAIFLSSLQASDAEGAVSRE